MSLPETTLPMKIRHKVLTAQKESLINSFFAKIPKGWPKGSCTKKGLAVPSFLLLNSTLPIVQQAIVPMAAMTSTVTKA